jgi:hypothetical protein
MDSGALPPEVNSGRMYSGPGGGSMLAAAAAWDGLARRVVDISLRRSLRRLLCDQYWEHMDPDKEDTQAPRWPPRQASRITTRHLVHAGRHRCLQIPLDDDRIPTLLDRYKVTHFDAEGEVDHRFRDLGISTTSYIRRSTGTTWSPYCRCAKEPDRTRPSPCQWVTRS